MSMHVTVATGASSLVPTDWKPEIDRRGNPPPQATGFHSQTFNKAEQKLTLFTTGSS